MARQRTTLKPHNPILIRVWRMWRPTTIKTVSEWADKRRYLTRMTSPIAGRWKTSTFPYTKDPMDAYSNPMVRLVVLKWATQSGKTEVQLNCLGWTIDENPGPTLFIYPTDKVLGKVSATRIQPMVNTCPTLREKKHLDPNKFKTAEMHFQDMILFLATAQSGSDISSMPIENLNGDELKDWPAYTSGGKGADPIKYGTDRQKNYPYTKTTLLVSSPLDEKNPISKIFKTCIEQLYVFVPCPHCGEHQRLIFWDHVYWEEKEGLEDTDPAAWEHAKAAAYYVCEHCGATINDHDKLRMLQSYKWLREDGTEPSWDAESIGFQLSSLYSPLITFGDIVHEFLECRHEQEKFKNFITGWLGEEWKQVTITTTESDILEARCALLPQIAPQEAVLLTAGIDCQKNGFWFLVRAWARNWTSWLIDYGYLSTWDEIDSLLYQTFYPRDGEDHKVMPISRACLDTGGGEGKWGLTMTNEAYAWLSTHKFKRGCQVWGTKGDSSPRPGRLLKISTIENMTTGQKLKYPVQIAVLNTDMLKRQLHDRLDRAKREEIEAAYLHCDVTPEYAAHILAEELQIDQKGVEMWVRVKRTNHLLDCECLAMVAADKEWPARPSLNMIREPIIVSHQSSEAPKQEVQKKQGFIPTPRNSLFERGRRLL